MEVPVINRISDFEVSLQNPSLVSGVLSLSGKEAIPKAYSFWKWGALIVALLASFSAIINRIKLLILKFQRDNPIASSQPLLGDWEDDFDTDSEDEICSSSSYSEDEEEEPDSDEHFRVAGSRHYEKYQGQNCTSNIFRRFSWTDLASGRNVVKLWDHLGIGLDFDDDDDDDEDNNSSEGFLSVYDMNRGQRIGSIVGGKPVSTSAAGVVIVTAGENMSSLRVWDTRLRRRIPAMLAEWRPHLGKIVNYYGGGGAGVEEEVYVRDNVTGDLTVGDLRNVSSPIANLTESEVDTWWDADAVIVSDEFYE